jgi:hypothetical protein
VFNRWRKVVEQASNRGARCSGQSFFRQWVSFRATLAEYQSPTRI